MFGSVANTGMTVGCNALLMVGNVIGGGKNTCVFCRRQSCVHFCTGRSSRTLAITNLTETTISADNIRRLLACALPKHWRTPFSS